MHAHNMSPAYEENWLDLLIAIIEAAHRDANKPTVPEPMRQEAHEFLQWARDTIAGEDTPPFFGA